MNEQALWQHDQRALLNELREAGIDPFKTKLHFELQKRKKETQRLMPRYTYTEKDISKLDRYRDILIGTLDKYWDSGKPIYKHQETRIWKMIHREFPNVVILDGHYND